MLNVVDFFRENTGRWAPSTQKLYERHLLEVSEWLGPIDTSQVTTEQLVQWLNGHSWGLSSRRNALIALRVFFQWAVGEKSPAARIHLPKAQENSSRRALYPQEARDLLATPDTSTVKGTRDLAILSLMMDTGLRAAEICNALIGNLHLPESSMQILVKGGRWEWAVFTSHTQRAMHNWLSVRGQVAVERRHIFVSLGGPKKGTRLSSRGLWSTIAELSSRAGIGHVCPHELRHSFAMLAMKAGASTRAVQMAGRWKDINQLQRYTQRMEMETIRPHLPMTFLMDN